MEASRRGIHFLQLLQVPSGTQGTRLCQDMTAASGCILHQDHGHHNMGQDTVLWEGAEVSAQTAQLRGSALLCKAQ